MSSPTLNELAERLKRVGDEIAGMRKRIEAGGLIAYARFAEADQAACVECGRVWLDSSGRWRSYLTVDDEPVLYCPECAAREFGGEDA